MTEPDQPKTKTIIPTDSRPDGDHPPALTQVTQLAGRIGFFGSANADSWQKSSLHLYDFVDATQPLRQRQA